VFIFLIGFQAILDAQRRMKLAASALQRPLKIKLTTFKSDSQKREKLDLHVLPRKVRKLALVAFIQ